MVKIIYTIVWPSIMSFFLFRMTFISAISNFSFL